MTAAKLSLLLALVFLTTAAAAGWGTFAVNHATLRPRSRRAAAVSTMPGAEHPVGKYRRAAPPQQQQQQQQPSQGPVHEVTYVQQGTGMKGRLVLRSARKLQPTKDEERFILTRLQRVLRRPSEAQVLGFRDQLLKENRNMSTQQILSMSPEHLVKALLLSELFQQLRDVLVPMQVDKMTLDLALA